MRPGKDEATFQERIGRAAETKQKALDHLRAKPPVEPEVIAARQAARERRETAEAEKRAAKQAEEQARNKAKATKAAADAEARAKPEKAPLTEAEAKQARDARYAARKNRK